MQKRVKRLIDVVGSLLLMILLMPIHLILLILVRLNLGSPVFFKHTRPGLRGVPFVLIKFRSMTNAIDSNGISLSDELRLTPFGKLLRSTSLDEIPSLWNVLKGDMSLVGPRPLLMEYLSLYSDEQNRRHDIKPGITGWAQVNGRNAISWGEKFKLDVWYVDNQSLWLDFKILFLTVKKVIGRDGVSSDEHVTVQPFNGNKQ